MENNYNRKAQKFLPYNALVGYRERLDMVENDCEKEDMPELSSDQYEDLDIIALDCYANEINVTISYFEQGKIKKYKGIITLVDLYRKEIVLFPKRRFKMEYIVNMER